MKSPFTGGDVQLRQEQRELSFRKEKFGYLAQYYVCVDTQERFSTTELDELNTAQVYNQYRAKYGIPFPDEIVDIRESYGLSASKMSEILGLGANQYRLYENGEMPSEMIGKTLRSIMNPMVFASYVHSAENQFAPQDYVKLCEKIERARRVAEEKLPSSPLYTMAKRSAINGFAAQSFEKLGQVVLYLLDKLGAAFPTKLNKLLFYADFCSYKRRGVGITGLAYKAIQYGPVPERWDRLYVSIEDVEPEIVSFSSGNAAEQLVAKSSPDMGFFSKDELAILDEVLEKLGNKSANQLSELTHQEDAWLHFKDSASLIDYAEAFTLKAL